MTEKTDSSLAPNGESFDPEAWLSEFGALGGIEFYGDGDWHLGWKEFGNDDAERAAELFRALTAEDLTAVAAYRDLHPALGRDTLRTVAEAWVNRWCALGGAFGRILNPDGSPRAICRGIPMSYTWEPPTWEKAQAMSPALRPHEHIMEREDFDGAQKMLESFLTLVPGLRDAVHDIADDVIEIAGGHASPEVIGQMLALRKQERAAEGNPS